MSSQGRPTTNTGNTSPGWRLAFWTLSCSAFVLALMFVWLQTQQVRAGYRLAKLQEEQAKQLDFKRKLELNWTHLTTLQHLEEIARTRLRMAPPDPRRIVFMQ